ncbi:hypothetical protein B566_EDAN010971 [Ephemera danica]|nr:hypothetical protein B566_EDAN010971 [Ephemera danica]
MIAGCYVFATEWAPCGDLAGAVAKAPGPSEAAIRGVAAQIGSALEFMHSKSLAHRDLKLENVLVFAPDLSRVKLADMGSTRRTGSLVAPVQTWRPFLPPEECGVLPKERYTCSVAGDTWQLAILVLVALSGAPPWRSADISDFDYCQFARWQKRRTTKLPAKFKAYTPRFLRLLRRMLEPKLDKRAPISDVQKYVSDSWLVVSRGVPQGGLAALQQGEDGSDSLLYLNSRGDQSKRGLAKLLSSYGLETTVDRQEMTRRLCEWVLSCDTSDDGSVTESV